MVALVVQEKSAPKRRVKVNVNAKLRGRNAENNATAKERYAKTG